MVLELHAPAEPTFAAPQAVVPTFLVYALSFLMVAIMWINHHHFFLHARRATPGLIWSNIVSALLDVADSLRHGVARPAPYSPGACRRLRRYARLLLPGIFCSSSLH